MTLEEQAEIICDTITKIMVKLGEMDRLARFVLRSEELNGDICTFTNEDKQKAIDLYFIKKAELVILFSELP